MASARYLSLGWRKAPVSRFHMQDNKNIFRIFRWRLLDLWRTRGIEPLNSMMSPLPEMIVRRSPLRECCNGVQRSWWSLAWSGLSWLPVSHHLLSAVRMIINASSHYVWCLKRSLSAFLHHTLSWPFKRAYNLCFWRLASSSDMEMTRARAIFPLATVIFLIFKLKRFRRLTPSFSTLLAAERDCFRQLTSLF